MGKRGKLSANKSNASNGGPSKKIKANGQGNSQNGTSSHLNSSNRNQARSNPKPDAIDEDLWPAEEAFGGSELESLELVRSVMVKQMKRIEQELFREDHNNQLAGIQTQVGPTKDQGKSKLMMVTGIRLSPPPMVHQAVLRRLIQKLQTRKTMRKEERRNHLQRQKKRRKTTMCTTNGNLPA